MLGRDVGLPDVCNRDCVYCFEPHEIANDTVVPADWRLPEEWKESIRNRLWIEKGKITTENKMQYYEFTGLAEPLLYLPVIAELMKFLRGEVDPFMGTRGWAKLYTNGILLDRANILKLKELGFDEIRVHPGASSFSKEVYANMRLAAQHIPTLTVETPAWPLHREKLFEMLPLIQDIGIKHLDICQIEITGQKQLEQIEKALGEVVIYQAFYPMVDDGGLVEDIMREVLAKGYTFSVIDCNGFVKQSRSAFTNRSYWNILNRKYPPEWEFHRKTRTI
jgi:pyruvate formate-lyase activating enzyme-like uncharacterized protein